MSDLLSIGASGVRAYQSALTTVSENIANAGVSGYARRSVDLKEVASVGGGLTAGRTLNGMGVLAAGVKRANDVYLSTNVRNSGADLARTETGAAWLERVQSALTGNQLGDRITSFFTSARSLAADPTSTAARAQMLEAGTSVAAAFAGTGRALDQVAADLDTTADQAVDSLNSLGTALAKVNDGLARSSPGSSGAAALADQRDQLLEQMSALSDVNVTLDAAGRATVKLGGGNGPVFVAGNSAGQVSYVRNDEGAVSFALLSDGAAHAITPGGGALAGVADASQRVQDARAALAANAQSFADGVNAVQAHGRDANGATGAAMFGFGAGGAPAMTMSLTDPAGIAAAAVGEGARGNGNLAALDALRSSGGFEAKQTSLVATVAATLQQRQTVADAQGAIRDSAVSARDAVSGVNLDSEAVDLLRFQQAYSASSRVIQVARETLQSIMDIK